MVVVGGKTFILIHHPLFELCNMIFVCRLVWTENSFLSTCTAPAGASCVLNILLPLITKPLTISRVSERSWQLFSAPEAY